MNKIPEGSSGKYRVTTASGTEYVLDMDDGYATRQGAPGHGWDDGDDMGYGGVTGDGIPMRVTDWPVIEVGFRMVLQNSDEWRISTTVQTIERL